MSIPQPQIKQEPNKEDETVYQPQTIDQNLQTRDLNPQVYLKTEIDIKPEIETKSVQVPIKSEPTDCLQHNNEEPDETWEPKRKAIENPNQKPKRIRNRHKDDIVELIIDNDVYVCGICKKTFRIRGYAIRHIENHKKNGENEQNFVEMHQKIDKDISLIIKPINKYELCCQRCDKAFKQHEYLLKHLKWNKCKGREDLLCKTCNTQFDSYTLYKTHLTTHEPKRNQCEICSTIFKFKNQLQTHYKSAHNNSKPYKCDLCEKTFAKQTQLSGHLISHSNTRPYACKKCGKRFKHKQNVKKHLETHNKEVNLTCKMCEKTFPRESRLKYHMRTHDKERPFKCDLCHKCFSHKNNVLRHLMYKHPSTLLPDFVKEYKTKLRKWADRRYYSKHILESLKYCIYKGNKFGDISAISAVENFNSLTLNQSTGVNIIPTDVSQNGLNSNLNSVKNELNVRDSAKIEGIVSLKSEPKSIEPECILGLD